MKWLIPIDNRKEEDCLLHPIISYLEYLKREHTMIYSGQWSFYYNDHYPQLGNNINQGNYDLSFAALSKFHGLSVIRHHVKCTEDLRDLIIKRLPLSPLIVGVDIFDIEWNRCYRINHKEHYVMICNYCSDNDMVSVCEVFSHGIQKYIRLSDLTIWSGNLFVFNIAKPCFIQSDVENEIFQNLTQIKNSLPAMERFCSALSHISDYTLEVGKAEDFYSINLLWEIKRLSYNRKNFREMLIYSATLYPALNLSPECSESLTILTSKYETLRLFIGKEIVSKVVSQEIRSKLIAEIIELESNCIGILETHYL